MKKLTWMASISLILLGLLASCTTTTQRSSLETAHPSSKTGISSLPKNLSTEAPDGKTLQSTETEAHQKNAANQIKSWQINGKIAMQSAKQSGSASVNWTQRGNQFYISIMGPGGVGALNLSGYPGKVVLHTGNGKTFVDRSPEHLLAKGFGYNLPVSHLKYWVRGLPSPNLSMSTRYDHNGRLRTLIQEGWVIHYLGYSRRGALDLPNKIFISSPSLKVKIMIYQWRV